MRSIVAARNIRLLLLRCNISVLRHQQRQRMGGPGVTPGIETHKGQCGAHLIAEVPERKLYTE